VLQNRRASFETRFGYADSAPQDEVGYGWA